MFKKDGKKSCVGDIYCDDLLELSDDDSSDDKKDLASETSVKRDISFISKPDGNSAIATPCLPSAGEMFEAVTKPSFLEVKKTNDIDWEKVTADKSGESKAMFVNTHAIPPPESYDSQTPGLKPTLGDTAVPNTSHKRHLDGNEDDPSSDTDIGKKSRTAVS